MSRRLPIRPRFCSSWRSRCRVYAAGGSRQPGHGGRGGCHLSVQQPAAEPGGWQHGADPAQEAQEHAGVWRYLNELLAGDNPIAELQVFDLRESMANGGGPACLRLRVVLTAEEYQAVNPHVLMNDTLFATLNDWVDRYYRDRLTQADLADPQLLREGREALDRLTQILQLGSVYPFQQ
jgi:hypothetical protein